VPTPRASKSSRISLSTAIAWRTAVADWIGVTGSTLSGYRLVDGEIRQASEVRVPSLHAPLDRESVPQVIEIVGARRLHP
jgi:hypothetical protein